MNKVIAKLLLLLAVSALFNSCKKDGDEDNRKISLEELPSIYTSEQIYQVLYTSKNQVVFSTTNAVYITDASFKNVQKMDVSYANCLSELGNGNILAVSANGMNVLNPTTLTKQSIYFNAAPLQPNTIYRLSNGRTVFYTASQLLISKDDDLLAWTDITGSLNVISGCQLVCSGNDIYFNSASDKSIYKSSDNGANFSLVCKYPNNSSYTGNLSVSPNGDLYMSMSDGSTYISTNGGGSFTTLALPDGFNGVKSSYFFGNDGSVHAISQYAATAYASSVNGTFKHTGGLDCQLYYTLGPNMVIGGKDGLYLSQDNGKNWKSLGSERLVPNQLYFVNNVLYAKAKQGIFQKNRLYKYVGGAWYVVPQSFCMAYTHAGNNVYYFLSNSDGYYSEDGGQNFTYDNQGLSALKTGYDAIADDGFARKNGQILAQLREGLSNGKYTIAYAITYNASAHKWEFVGNQSGLMENMVENANGNLFGTSTDPFGNIYEHKSTDGAATWTSVNLDYYPLCFNSANNFVAEDGNTAYLLFSSLGENKIYEYNFESGNKNVTAAAFDNSDYLYLSDMDGKIFKSKSTMVKPK
ncbi:MAG: hypothetical protein ACKOXB_01830 [Flavobacteriales bacterium]